MLARRAGFISRCSDDDDTAVSWPSAETETAIRTTITKMESCMTEFRIAAEH